MSEQRGSRTTKQLSYRRSVWNALERMSAEVERPVEDLINEALREFVVAKGYSLADSPAEGDITAEIIIESRPTPAPAASSSGSTPSAPDRGTNTESTPPGLRPRTFAESVVTWTGGPGGARATPAPQAVTQVSLFVMFDGQKTSIDKEQFVVGRGSKFCDLVIKDPNVSRRHAAIMRRSGSWYIQDLGSTNGIDYKGMRIDNKRIDEGDIFRICDHEIRFTYRE